MDTTREEIDLCTAVADGLEAWAAGKITWDEFSLQTHDKRYHPHGYKEGDVCKYRDGEGGSGDTAKAAKEYYSKVAASLKDKDAISVLPKQYGIEPVYAASAEALYREHGFTLGVAMDLEEQGSPTAKDVHKRNVDAFLCVISDLSRRYPGMSLFPAKLISWNLKIGEAWSSVDNMARGRTRYFAIGDIFNSTKAPSPYHVIRHEIGHNLTTFEILDAWVNVSKRFASKRAFDSAVAEVSDYATTADEEAIAEIFAFYTDPLYEKGRMNKTFESFAERLITFSKKSKEQYAMDDNGNKKRNGVEPIDGIYYDAFDTFKEYKGAEIIWFDKKKGEVKFDSYESKLRYGLRCYKVPNKWIDRFITEFPKKEWSDWDIERLQYEYRETDTSLEDIIAFYKKWGA